MAAQNVRHMPGHVVVGTDGSAAAKRAVAWAAHEAAYRRLPLRIVHGFAWPALHAPAGGDVYLESGPSWRETADELLTEAARAARTAEPGLEVQTNLVSDSGTVALLNSAHDATLLVVGTRGRGGFSGLIVGSTAVQLATHAHCPVVAVREDEPPRDHRRIVVGVDASDHAHAAVGFAFEEAAVRAVPLHAVHATGGLSTEPDNMIPLVSSPSVGHDDSAGGLTELLAEWSEKFPDVAVTRQVEPARPRNVLLHESRNAQLLVVGARGAGGFRGLLFGSVSQAMLHHAHCPVAVVRATG